MKNKFALLVFVFCCKLVFAEQNDSLLKDVHGLTIRTHYGFFIAHRYNIQHMSNAHFPMLELNYNIQTLGNESWKRKYYYPTYGIGYSVCNAGNKQLMGTTQALFPYINFNYVRKHRLSVNFRLGLGLGRIEKPFNRLTNHANLAIGSKFNAYINIGQDLKIKLNNRSAFTFGIHLHHQSNGAYKVPNLGINLATVATGYTYYFNDLPKQISTKKDTSKFKSLNEFSITAGGFVKEIYPILGPKYPIFVASINGFRRFSEKAKWGIGIDFMHNTAIREYNKVDSNKENDNVAISQIGTTLSYEVIISKVSFPLQLGYYAFSKYKDDGPIYQRIGVRYNVYKNLMISLMLKTHYAKAEYSEWGIGYKF